MDCLNPANNSVTIGAESVSLTAATVKQDFETGISQNSEEIRMNLYLEKQEIFL